jgi:hypothetical protein
MLKWMRNPTAELVSRVALAWMDNKPFSEEGRARRKAKREAKRQQRRKEGKFMPGEQVKVVFPDGREVARTEPIVQARVSTKLGGTSGVGTIVLGVAGILFPDFVNSLTPDQALWIGGLITSVIAYFTARFTKSPSAPQAL